MKLNKLVFALFLCAVASMVPRSSFGQNHKKAPPCDRNEVLSTAVFAFEETQKLSSAFSVEGIAALVGKRDKLLENHAPECKALALTIQDLLNIILITEAAKHRIAPVNQEALQELDKASRLSTFAWNDLRKLILSLEGGLPDKMKEPLQRPDGSESNDFAKKVLELRLKPDSKESWIIARQQRQNPALLDSEFLATYEQQVNFAFAFAIEVAQTSQSRELIISTANRINKPVTAIRDDLQSVLPKGFDLKGVRYDADQTLAVLDDYTFDAPESFKVQSLMRLRPYLLKTSVDIDTKLLPKKIKWGFLLPRE
jgi:hypothetical protein